MAAGGTPAADNDTSNGAPTMASDRHGELRYDALGLSKLRSA
jgi:hypothetical protein